MGDPFESESTAGEKFFLVSVPKWDTAGGLSSFLCLGGVSGDPGKNGDPNYAKAETLAQLVQGFVDDDRERGTPPNSAPAETAPAGSPAPNPVPTPTDPNAQGRRNESAVLHTKGGWRDHSDGNRISTTVGDKVEVIRGNYKLVVLGRQDELQNSTGVDMSGGITDPSTTAMEYAALATGGLDGDFAGSGPPAGTNNQAILENIWQWVTTDDDSVPRWHVTQRTGNIYQANTAMVTKTWAYSIDTYTGSSETPVHEMSDTTFADSQTSTTTLTHDLNVNLTADNVNNTTSFNSVMSTTAHCGGICFTNTMYTPFDISNVNFSFNVIYTDLCLLSRNELDVAPFITEMKISSAIQEFKIGNHTDLHAMTHIDAHMGSHVDLHLGPHLDIHTEDVTLGETKMSMHDARAHLSDVFNFL